MGQVRRLWLCVLLGLPLWAQPYYHIIATGQSLALGAGGAPALSTSQPPPGATVHNQKALWQGGFQDWVEGTRSGCEDATNGCESPTYAMAGMVTRLSGGTRQESVYLSAGSGAAYSALKKGGTGASYSDAIGHSLENNKASIAACDAVVVVHGEADTDLDASSSTYEGYLVEWQHDYETDCKAATGQATGVPMFHTQTASWTRGSPQRATPTTTAGAQGVALGIWQAAKDHADTTYLVGPKYQYAYYTDGMHLINTSYRALGSLYAKAVKKVVVDGQKWIPLAPRSITRSGAVITLQCWVPAGSLTRDTSVVPAQTNDGFEFWDDSGATPAITGVTITGADTIQISLASAPSGANQRLRYAYTGTVGAKAGTNNGQNYARGNMRDSDPTTDPWGNQLYDWLVVFDEPVGFSWNPIHPASSRAVGRARFSGRGRIQ